MLSKQKIKFINSLKHNKYRLKSNCFVAEGEHVVNEFIKSKFKIKFIFSTDEWNNKYQIDTSLVKKNDLQNVSCFKTPSNVLAVFHKPNVCIKPSSDYLMDKKNIILLDSISDPGNMGSIIRTADWYGVKDIFLSKNCVDIFNPKVVQSSMGSLARVQVHQVSLSKLLIKIKKLQILCYGATLSGKNIYACEKPDSCALVFGSEAHGIRKELIPLLDEEIMIPSNNKFIDSLNVSVAFGIILSEFR